MLSGARIKIQIDQLSLIIHLCSGGSVVAKHKWPSRCLMSSIIILAICQGFEQHLIRAHRPVMDCNQSHCLLLTNRLYWLCVFYLFFNVIRSQLGYSFNPHLTRTFSLSLAHPQPPPPSRSLDYVEPESGKVSLWKQGQIQRWVVCESENGGAWKKTKKKGWEVDGAEESMPGQLILILFGICIIKGRWGKKKNHFHQ